MSISSIIQGIIDRLTRRQAEALKVNIATTFVLGWKQSGTKEPLSALQKEQIAKVYKDQMGYISRTNDAIAESMAIEIKTIISKGGSQEDIRKGIQSYITDVFGDKGIEINNIGEVRKYVTVGKDGTLSIVEKTITRKYGSTIQNYSDVVAKTVSHQALESGRISGYEKQGVKKLMMIGPQDERARPEHFAAVGTVFEIGSPEEEMIRMLLAEPRCRHRTVPYIEGVNVSQETFDKRKEDAGLFFDESAGKWAFKE